MFGLKRRFKRRKLFDKEYVSKERRKTRLIIFLFVWGVIFTWLAENFVVSLEVIKGESMYPTLEEGDYHLVNKFTYYFRKPERGDLVVIKNIWLKEDQLIKRIIGIPGDVIEIKGGGVYINGERLDEPYAAGRTYPDLKFLELKDKMYFVLGDNREVSYDSRMCGLINRRGIRGKLAPDRLFALR